MAQPQSHQPADDDTAPVPTLRAMPPPNPTTAAPTAAAAPQAGQPPQAGVQPPRPQAGQHVAQQSAAQPAPQGGVQPKAQAGPRPAAQTFPERPKLAPGVRLAGQMQESAFEDPPWLLERENTGYIQVTRPLYRIAELCDGQHTVQEISADVTETTGAKLGPAAVQRLVAGQLIAKGLVAQADGSVVQAPRGAASLLAINAKMKMVGPELIDPFTRVLQYLYWPPILIAVLLAAFAAEIWLYFIHGVGGSLHDALYAPGLLALVYLIIVLAAGFHELGHAAALRYAGGRAKTMGAGFYLVYPAFYTDVSDNYRLGRWARIRTDLAGFYFNLIFALGIMAIYVATGQEFLLLIVALINLEIIHQLIPFARLDGYWTLVDLTGLPDFFSLMGAFLRSLVPGHKMTGRRLPPLKWWAKGVFLLYILLAIPVIGLFLFAMIRGFPRIMATAWESAGMQLSTFGTDVAGADVGGAIAAIVQLVALSLPTVGMIIVLVTLVRKGFGALWRWSSDSTVKRGVAGLATAAVAALVVFLWVPELPFRSGGSGPLYAESQFRPIQANERGTVGDAIADVPVVGASLASPLPRTDSAPLSRATVTPEPTVGAGADATAGPTSEGTPGTGPGGLPVLVPLNGGRATATATTNPNRSATPAAGAAARPTGTPGRGTPTVGAGSPTIVGAPQPAAGTLLPTSEIVQTTPLAVEGGQNVTSVPTTSVGETAVATRQRTVTSTVGAVRGATPTSTPTVTLTS
ncbi:MAG: putative peptide zinc metalloprotease protein [Chloroflexota bacterium]|nr:putative peptide zinc metalloprotease protein [Chloroflexota bacterium]